MNIQNITITVLTSIVFLACNNGPKVITAQSRVEEPSSASGIFSEENTGQETMSNSGGTFTENLHTVVVNEVLPASRYVYLHVTEGGESFWIATRKQDITKGGTYFYRGGLLKTNFESKEYNKVFEKIFLVSNLVAEQHGDNTDTLTSVMETSETKVKKETIPTHTEQIVQHKGSIKISDIVANPKAYEGKTVQITGKCFKVNPNIMQRNWIHLRDGSKDDFDLVVTSNTFVSEGQVVTMQAKVSLNRDFGAGYRYDLILENGIVIE